MKQLLIAFAILSIAACSSKQRSSSAIYEKLRPCKIAGIQDSLLCGNYAVIENRESNTGRMINLNIVVIPAQHRDSLLAPIFMIEGGPGVAATKSAEFFADPAVGYRQYHDIVLIDARGTGKSNPLNCLPLQYKASLQDQFRSMYPADSVRACRDSLSKQADLTQYTTTNIVKDIDDVRKWLGYDKINLYGLSYGTRVSLVYMKLFPQSVESCILWSPTPTYSRMPQYHARFAQDALEKIFNDCRSDSACSVNFPNLEKEFNALMEKGKAAPFVYQRTVEDHTEQLTIPWNAFQTKIRSLMYDPVGIRKIPYVIHQAWTGNMQPFISFFPQTADLNDFIADGMYLCVTCAEDVPFIRNEEIDSLTKGTFMGTYRIDQQKTACANWARGEIPKDFLQPVQSDIPTLIFSGPFDPITPPAMAKEIASHLTNSRMVTIPYMSHTFFGLQHAECFDNMALAFLNDPAHKMPNTSCVAQMLPEPYKIR